MITPRDLGLDLVNGVHHVADVLHVSGDMASTQERILNAAFRAFVRGGLDAISMRRLAAALDLTAPAIYKHFDSKDRVIEAVAERGFALFEHRLAADKTAADPIDEIARILNAYVLFALDEPHLFEIMFVTPRARLRRFPEDFESGRSPTFTLLRTQVDACTASGVLRADDSLEVSRDLWAIAHGYIALYRAGRFGTDRKALVRAFTVALPRLFAGLRSPARSVSPPRKRSKERTP